MPYAWGMKIFDFSAKGIDGHQRALEDYEGKALLVVNVASECGLTPHYAGLQALYEKYREQGLLVLGFPCNQFGAQEPGSEEEIQQFCSTKYAVTFPLFAKIDVNGEARHPLYAWLTSQDTAPDGPGDIAWNFAKFVVGRDGKVLARFAPQTEPDSAELRQAVERALG